MVLKKIATFARRINAVDNLYDQLRFIVYRQRVFKMFDFPESKEIKREMAKAYRKYGWYPDEFFLYHYENLTDEERHSIIGEKEHGVIAEIMNDKECARILSDKWDTYCQLKTYFHREAILVDSKAKNKRNEEAKRLSDFLKRKGRLIIKPRCGSFGRGIQIITAEETSEEDIIRLIAEYPNGIIAEEVIAQVDSLATLHPESVNTLRIHTISYNGEVVVFHPYLRIGRGKNCVDNAGSGGLFTSCNPETGEILSVVDEYGHTFVKHPDNGIMLVGFTIPCWQDAIKTAESLARNISGIHYAGWDLALTKDGWVLIEGNPCAQMVFQISEQKGFRGELETIMQKFNMEIPSARK